METPLSLEYIPSDTDEGRTMYFDMDGTLANLYGVTNVFRRLDNNDASTYLEAAPTPQYVEMLKSAKDMGYRVGIITAGSRFPPDTPQEVKDKMNEDTEEAKIEWLKKYDIWPLLSSFQFIPYGVNKYSVAKDKTGVLVDDEDKVLNQWFSDRIKAIPIKKAKF